MAQEEIHALSVQMNKGEREAVAAESQARQLHDIEALVEGCIGVGAVVRLSRCHGFQRGAPAFNVVPL